MMRNRLAKTLLILVLGLAFTIAEAYAYASYLHFPVEINGRKVVATRHSSLEAVLEKEKVTVEWGDLLDVKGNVIRTGGGGRPRVWIDGMPGDLDSPLEPGAVVRISPGQDVTEEVTTVVVEIPAPVRVVGTGSFIVSEDQGIPGLKSVTRGAVSGKVVSTVVLTRPKPGKVVRASTRPGKVVALTFDDGPHPVYTPRILRLLRRHKAKATFFAIGRMVKAYPEVARSVVAGGHQLGNHSYSHAILNRISAKKAKQEIRWGQRSIEVAVGAKPKWLRPPGGAISRAVLRICRRRGIRIAMWSVDPQDWRKPPAREIARRVVVNAQPGMVVLLHDGGGNREQTVRAVPRIVKALRNRGYRFVTVEELYLRRKARSAND